MRTLNKLLTLNNCCVHHLVMNWWIIWGRWCKSLVKLMSSVREVIVFDKVAFKLKFLVTLQALTLLLKFRCCERFALIIRIGMYIFYILKHVLTINFISISFSLPTFEAWAEVFSVTAYTPKGDIGAIIMTVW